MGGDIGNTRMARYMNNHVVAKLDFDLIVVGGDVAYDNNVPE